MYIEIVKKISASVLYLDGPEELDDSKPLGEHGFSSIDYIDLCFEMKSQISEKITPENLWPFNSMATKKEFFDGSNWTDEGWQKVCEILDIAKTTEPFAPKDLMRFFTPNMLSKRVEQILNG